MVSQTTTVSVEPLSRLIGKRLLVGITYVEADGSATHQVQFVGVVIEVAVTL